jgi:CDP-paratose 2-epimerase
MLDRGDNVTIIDDAVEPRNRWIAGELSMAYANNKPAVVFERLELMDREDIGDAIEECDAVLHAAASTGIPYSVTAPADDWERNVEGTRTLVDALRECPKPTVVLSSVKPYRVPAEKFAMRGGLTEEAVLEPDEPYAASKAAQTMLTMAYARSYGLPIVTFRCSNLYGPAPCHGPRHGWLTWLAISAAIGRPLRVEGTGDQLRDMLHANDVTSAVLAAIEHMNNIKGEAFNVGGGHENLISVNQAARILQEATGARIVNAPARAMDDQCVYVNYGKIHRAIGWAPKASVLGGLRDVLAWAQRNRDELAKLYSHEGE